MKTKVQETIHPRLLGQIRQGLSESEMEADESMIALRLLRDREGVMLGLNSHWEWVRLCAVEALAEIDGCESIPTLEKISRRDSSEKVRRAAAIQMCHLAPRHSQGVELVEKLLRSEDEQVRFYAVVALSHCKGDRGRELLIGAARDDPDLYCREMARKLAARGADAERGGA